MKHKNLEIDSDIPVPIKGSQGGVARATNGPWNADKLTIQQRWIANMHQKSNRLDEKAFAEEMLEEFLERELRQIKKWMREC